MNGYSPIDESHMVKSTTSISASVMRINSFFGIKRDPLKNRQSLTERKSLALSSVASGLNSNSESSDTIQWTQDEGVLVCWLVYTMKSMCIGNTQVINGINHSVSHKEQFHELLRLLVIQND